MATPDPRHPAASTGHSSYSTQDVPTHSNFETALQRLLNKSPDDTHRHRSLGVSFESLKVIGLGASALYQDTVSSTLNPLGILEVIKKARHPAIRSILEGFQGVVRPGQMLLVLGNPGSGCSTLLKVLANQRQEFHKVEGEVHYDSLLPTDIANHYRGDVLYCPEEDVHFPSLRVEDTLRFAAASRTGHKRTSEFTRDGQISHVTETLANVFGLQHTLRMPVGDATVKGVSGGEKKRVSIAEALATRAALTSFDNSTRGLDASTALEFIQALRVITDTFQLSSIVSIYQAAEKIFRLFDKVCVIYEGRMAYYGPASQARQYFIDLGYVPVNRQTTADFLTAVTDPLGRIPRADALTRPKTAKEFAAYFLNSRHGRDNRVDIDAYKALSVDNSEKAAAFAASYNADKVKRASKSSPYVISLPRQVQIVMLRRLQIMRGDMLLTGLNLFSFVFQALIVGSTFYNSPQSTAAFFSRAGVLFFAILFAALTALAEIPGLYFQRRIVRRHQKAAMYHPFIDALAMTLVDIPITCGILGVFGIILYFMVQLQQSAEQFFIFLLFIFILSISMKAWFRAIAAAFKDEAGATSFAGVSILVLVMYSGFQVPKPSMIGALKWLTYLDPVTYGLDAVMSNEFRTLEAACANLVPTGPGYENISLENQVCATVGSVPGKSTVSGARFLELAYGFSYDHLWRNFGILVAFTLGFITMLLVFTELRSSSFVDISVVRFRRGAKTAALTDQNSGDDPEKAAAAESGAVTPTTSELDGKDVTPQRPITDMFSWQNVHYTIPTDDGRRQLIDNVSGYVTPGKLTALMGESGAGKTTLLDVLASRVSTGVVEGNRFVNGQTLPSDFQAQTGYVQQMDTHVPTATVREALIFSAKLRQSASVPVAEKVAYAEKCLTMCGLDAYADVIIGSLGVEHRKRTTIAVELAAKPSLLLFLDEPTSGLDSRSAWAIVSFLRTLANHGQAILCTIHQPSAELFQAFDRVLLLQKGGKTSYFGDLGPNATTLINYFESNGGRQCQEDENPAEWMLDVIGAGATAAKSDDWHKKWSQSSEAEQLQRDLEEIQAEGRRKPPVPPTSQGQYATSWFSQTWELLKRLNVAYWRDPTYIMAKLVLNIAGSLFIGFSFWQSSNSQQGIQNKLFAIFMATILSVPSSNQIQVPWVKNRKIFEIREQPSKMYSWTSLTSALILVELPWNILGSSFLFVCWYWTVGFDTDRAGYSYLVLSIILPVYCQTFAQAVASMAPEPDIAALLFSLLFSFVIIFNGVMQPYSQLGFWKWMYHLSPYTYAIEGLLGQAIAGQDIVCLERELAVVEPPNGRSCGEYMQRFIGEVGGYLTNPNDTSSCRYCSSTTTDSHLARSFNMFYSHHWRNVGILAAFIGFNVFLIFVLTFLFRIRQGSLIPSFKRSKKVRR